MRPTCHVLLTTPLRLAALLAAPLLGGCEPSVPENPTWADVEPILRANCTHCHGATAAMNGSAGTNVYRFDFFQMNEGVCGEAAMALDTPQMAHGWAPLILEAVSPPLAGGRARMPPAPAPALSDWERETLVRWAQNPTLGGTPSANRVPQVTLVGELACNVDGELDFTVLVDDPDGEPVVGLLRLGERSLRLDGPGAFHVTVSTSEWETGRYPALVSLCDGWDLVCYELPEIVVVH